MAYEIEWQGRVVYVRLFERVDVFDLAEVVHEIAANPEFDRVRFQIVDFDAATRRGAVATGG